MEKPVLRQFAHDQGGTPFVSLGLMYYDACRHIIRDEWRTQSSIRWFWFCIHTTQHLSTQSAKQGLFHVQKTNICPHIVFPTYHTVLSAEHGGFLGCVRRWDDGVAEMSVGERSKITVPPELGYGNRDVGAIPANSTLIFDIELIAAGPPTFKMMMVDALWKIAGLLVMYGVLMLCYRGKFFRDE